MGLFDIIKNVIKSEVTSEINTKTNQAINNAVNSVQKSVQNAVNNKSEKFTFAKIPTNVAELQALPEASLDSPFKTAALSVIILNNYVNDPEETFKMLDVLKGPEPLSPREKAFIRERMDGKEYKAKSFLEGATVQNNYTPSTPYTVTIYQNPHSFTEENHAKMFVQSSGADAMREVTLRKKPSTNQWFLVEIFYLSDIRIPAAEDKWA